MPTGDNKIFAQYKPHIRATKTEPHTSHYNTRSRSNNALATSPQHQLSIKTLATHLLLTTPPSNSRQSWDILRDIESHHNTLQRMLANTTLHHYHQVWYTILDTRQHTATHLPHTASTHLSRLANAHIH